MNLINLHLSRTDKKMLIYNSFVGLLLILTLSMCNNSKSKHSNQHSEVESHQKNKRSSKNHNSELPNDLTYKIINENTIPGKKRSLDIRLNHRISKSVLRKLAYKLKNKSSENYDKTFIGYYLPDMTVNAGYWATTYFNPDLNVRVIGTTSKEEKDISKKSQEINGKIIGKWKYTGGIAESRLTLFRKNGSLHMKRTYADGSSKTFDMIEKQTDRGKYLQEKSVNSSDHWLINKNGDLERRDDMGLIGTAKKIN